jgi:tRNA(adenine34) deaminase
VKTSHEALALLEARFAAEDPDFRPRIRSGEGALASLTTGFSQSDQLYMQVALEEARQAGAEGEVPVGAVVVRGSEIIGRGHDRKIALADPAAHAEILAIQEAARAIGDWRLEDCTIYVTLEPCPMCAGAILLGRMSRLVYGAPNFKFGAVGSIVQLFSDAHKWNHQVEVTPGCFAEECASLLTEFFAARRAAQLKEKR